MKLDLSLSIIVPAKNEEDNILKALASVKVLEDYCSSIEVILIDDGSTDKTLELAKEYLEKSFTNYHILSNDQSRNLGGVFKQGLQYASKDYVMVVQGQNSVPLESLLIIIQSFDQQIDIIIPYQDNYKERPFLRMIISRLFVTLLRFVSGVKLEYFNHSCLMKRSLLSNVDIKTNSYAYQAEILIKLIRSGVSYKEVAVRDYFQHKKKTNAFSFKNIYGIMTFFINLIAYRLTNDEKV